MPFFVYMCVSLVCVSQATTRGDTIGLSLLHTFLSGTRTNYRWIWIREIAVLVDTCIENGGRGERTRGVVIGFGGKLWTHAHTQSHNPPITLPYFIKLFWKRVQSSFRHVHIDQIIRTHPIRCIPTTKSSLL